MAPACWGHFIATKVLYLYTFTCIKAIEEVFVFEDVAHLVGDYLCVADNGIDVGVGMTVYPYVNVAVGNEIYQCCDNSGIFSWKN